ncbi:glycosyltransferase family 2 protein [Amnibacterium sp. CER49]|uniref:glycosyltransferase family 2 protein n=1 Tax=Amnibacterium sp. CER49 TaxID=3039161 RepID=UPI00244D2C9A|nr:glycosyltransferase family 2 protein [Amnibacterium sp. CER49]MDH2443053.1 glycosyltransferase family 2 protein [Amnibacterium sp. CER49]
MSQPFSSPAPAVGVVIATRGRPQLLRAAVRAALLQDHEGEVQVTVVFDQVEIDRLEDVLVPEGRTLRTIANTRSPGLAGGRNSGILATGTELIAFCDDDDEWLPNRLSAQLDAWRADPDAAMIASGVRIESAGGSHVRLPPARATFTDFLDSRITEIHPSTFLLRRADLLGQIGLVDEVLPASYGEDYDLLLRATRVGHVRSVVEPLVVVNWKRTSFFSGRWQGIADGLSYLLVKFPEFADARQGTARIAGQIAFANAALGHRREARRWARDAIRNDRRQLRAYAALAISAGLAPAPLLVDLVNRRGRGL